MTLKVCTSELAASGMSLHSCGVQSRTIKSLATFCTLTGKHTEVSGLDQLGAGHAGALKFSTGSAMQVLNSFTKSVCWLSDALNVSNGLIHDQDILFNKALVQGHAEFEVGVFPPKPPTTYTDFPFLPPVVNPAITLQALQAAFATTRNHEVTDAVRAWETMSADAAQLAADLHSIASEVAASNRGEVIDAAATTIEQAAAKAMHFSINAGAMALSVGNLLTIHAEGSAVVADATAKTAMITNPAQKVAAEEAFVGAFMTTIFPPMLQVGVPVLRNLMVTPPEGGYGSQIPTGMREIVAASGPALPKALRSLDAVTHNLASNKPGSQARAQAALEELQSISAPTTEAARTVLPTAADTSSRGAGTSFSPPSSTGMSSGVPSMAAIPTHPSGANTSIMGTRGPMLTGQRVSGGSPRGGASVHGHSLSGHGLAGAGRISGGVPSGASYSPGGQLHGALRPGAMPLGSASGGLAPGTATATAGSTTNSGSRSGVYGAPGGVAQHNRGAGSGRKKNPVRSVLMPAEQDANKRALLGKQRPVVPGPIGAWARQHPSERQGQHAASHSGQQRTMGRR